MPSSSLACSKARHRAQRFSKPAQDRKGEPLAAEKGLSSLSVFSQSYKAAATLQESSPVGKPGRKSLTRRRVGVTTDAFQHITQGLLYELPHGQPMKMLIQQSQRLCKPVR